MRAVISMMLLVASAGFLPAPQAHGAEIVRRFEPRVYDLTVDLGMPYDCRCDVRNIPVLGADEVTGEALMPVVIEGAYHQVDPQSVVLRVWDGSGREVLPLAVSRRDDQLFGAAVALAPLFEIPPVAMRWKLDERVQVWSVATDEAAAREIAWPTSWPETVQDGLGDQYAIDASHPVFAETVERVTQGQLRLIAPYMAAKELVRYAILNLQVTRPNYRCGCGRSVQVSQHPSLHLTGASNAARASIGTPSDLVCVCVALLRAAGIPARPVVGAIEDPVRGNRLVAWAELFLPRAGWIPFDPDEMRGQGLRTRLIDQPWKGFGNVDDLNERIPIAYEFVPSASYWPPLSSNYFVRTGGWGHTMQPGAAVPAFFRPRLELVIVSRGRGEDPARF